MKLSLILFATTLTLSESRKLGHGKTKNGKTKNGKQLQHKHVLAESRIVGGTQSTPGEYPFFVQWDGCGASLIYEDIILSAAHCNPISSNTVLIGAYKSESTDYDAEVRTIVERRSHPNYDDFTIENDFLVMKLNQTSTKTPIPLNSDALSPYDDEALVVMGFGATSEGNLYGSNFLREVGVNAVPHEICSSQYNGEIVEDVMLCAGVPGGGKDSCQGDSGGPIINSDGVQVGVVSWGYGCARPDFSGVYARMSGAIEWINEQVCELSDNPPAFCNSTNDSDSGDGDSTDESTVPVIVELVLDAYPTETGFVVRSSDGSVLAEYLAGSFSEEYGTVRETINLAAGEDYELEITDSYGDGLCCGLSGLGGYSVYADELLVVSGEADFADRLTVSFSVPSTNSSVSDCEDSSTTFLVDSEVGNSNCEWLGSNLDRYNYLCQFLDVAAACPMTCDACEYFE